MEGRVIIKKIKLFLKANPLVGRLFYSLGQINYLSSIKESTLVIGNSSSGIIEAPSLKTISINIGNRQKGRIVGNSVINCKATKVEICNAILKGISLSEELLSSEYLNPYEGNNTSNQILNTLKNVNLSKILNKRFYDFK